MPVGQRLLGSEPAVAVGVGLDLLQRLTGVLGDQPLHGGLDVQGLLGLDPDVAGRAAETAGGLVHHDPAVRQRVPLALRARAEQELTHRRGQAHGHGGDVVGDPVHGVVDRHAGVDRSTGRVDVQVDVLVRVLGVQQQHLRADRVGVLVADLGAQEDDPVLQQRLVDVVVEPDAARSPGCARTQSGQRPVPLMCVHGSEPTPRLSTHGAISHRVRCRRTRGVRGRPKPNDGQGWIRGSNPDHRVSGSVVPEIRSPELRSRRALRCDEVRATLP